MADVFPKKLQDTLRSLDLTEQQILLYLTTVKHGVVSVLELSKFTGIHRQQIYTETEKLVGLGLLEVTRKDRRKFIAAKPAALVRLAEQKKSEAEHLITRIQEHIPLLETIALHNNPDVTIRYYEGIAKIRDAYANELEMSRNVEGLCFAGSIDDLFRFFPESYWRKWNTQFVKQGSTSRMLVHYSSEAKRTASHDAVYGRETRSLEHFPMKVNIDVIENVVLIVSFYDEIAIWIESDMIAQSYRILFETLWPLAKPLK